MTNEELAIKSKTDKRYLTELIIKNEGIVKKLANKYYTEKTASFDFNDLVQEGYIGLMKCVEKFDPEKQGSATFVSFAVHYIKGYINRFIDQKNTNEEISLNQKPKYADEDYREPIDLIQDPDDYYEEVEHRIYCQQLRADLEAVMDEYLTLFERDVLKLRYGWDRIDPLTASEVADIYHVQIYTINSKVDAAIKKMRRSKWGAQQLREHYEFKKTRKYDSVEKFVHAQDYLERFSYLLKD